MGDMKVALTSGINYQPLDDANKKGDSIKPVLIACSAIAALAVVIVIVIFVGKPSVNPSTSPPSPSPDAWSWHSAVNCFPGHGGTPMVVNDLPFENFTKQECEHVCLAETVCTM